ncbi:MAG: carboxypeptidase M32 [Planctomycetota bacterium]
MSQYEALAGYLRESATLQSIGNVIAWDHETYMPPGGAEARAGQSAMLARLYHERQSADELGDLLAGCEDAFGPGDESAESANVREARRDFNKRTRVPADLVAKLAEARAKAQHAWKDARERSDYDAFRPKLDTVLELTREKARCLTDGGAELYDAMLDDYEPGMTAAQVEAVFTPLKAELTKLINIIADNGTPPNSDVLSRRVAVRAQEAFGRFVAHACGFSFERGRLDITTHPFCEGVAPGDTRMTTRYREDSWTDSLYGIMHEMGHGLYEQGLPLGPAHGVESVASQFGLPSGEAVSLGIHESQSRLWENPVGRGEAFWTFALPKAKELLGDAVADQTPASLASAVNTATPSLIRVEADEGTYNLHVMIRFELERALVSGDLSTADLPAAWNDAYAESLGVEVPDDAHGCLQDVHWSFGLFGYFPTYTLGNLHMAQLWDAIGRELPMLESDIAQGDFSGLLGWLRERIHIHGRRYPAAELTKRATGSPLSAAHLVRYLREKLLPNYGI